MAKLAYRAVHLAECPVFAQEIACKVTAPSKPAASHGLLARGLAIAFQAQAMARQAINL